MDIHSPESTAIPSPPAQLPPWAQNAIDLANPRLGAAGLYASDEFFAPLKRMLNPAPAVFIPGKYDDNGKWMDGWETRRKRTAGHDWCLIKLARQGRIHGFDVDTSHFTGNYAPAVSIDALLADHDDVARLQASSWQPILPPTTLQGNSHHLLSLADALTKNIFSHLRINIYPDGGIARLRVYGQVAMEAIEAGTLLDLIAMENGGRAIAWNDAHFGAPQNLILPGKGLNMGDGWETRRRREPGTDWCILQLGRPGVVGEIEVDTAFFKGNFPDRCSIQAGTVASGTDHSLISQSLFWPYLLPEVPLAMDRVFNYRENLPALGPITHIRINMIPDGGISRVRLWGRCT